MRWLLSPFLALILFNPPTLRADAPDPIRVLPPQADLVAKIDNPRELFDSLYGHEVVQEVLKIDAVAAYYDSTNFRRLFQLIAYVEKELGRDRLELLDRLTGGGVVLGAQFKEKAVVAAVSAKDEKLLERFVALSRKVLEQELARQDVKVKIAVRKHRGIETLHLGNDLHVARAGATLVFSNVESALNKAIDQHLSAAKDAPPSFVTRLQKHLPERPLAWAGLNLEQVRQFPEVKQTLESLQLNPVTMLVVGGVLDVVQRSPFVVAALTQEGKNYQARVVMPAGRNGMAPVAAMFLPEDDKGSLPLLQPRRVLFSTSYFIDLARFWEQRHKILTKENAKNLDDLEKQTGKFLAGLRIGTILQQSGRFHRVVQAQPEKSPYKVKPGVPVAAFAIVLDMRDPAFAKSMNTILRGTALFLGFQYGVRLVEEKHGAHTLVTYYFPENRTVEGDPENVRFNFSPCFTHVGNQFVVSSTLELGKDLVDCLVKETAEGSNSSTNRTHVYGAGLATNIRSAEDQLMTQAILSQALPPAAARKQLDHLIGLVERLGTLQFEVFYGQNDFRFDARWEYAK